MRTGHAPHTQHAAALSWLVTHHRATRWVLLGTHYVWPRAVHRAARTTLAGLGAQVVGEALVPFGPTDPGPRPMTSGSWRCRNGTPGRPASTRRWSAPTPAACTTACDSPQPDSPGTAAPRR